jgi:hypothetical protein
VDIGFDRDFPVLRNGNDSSSGDVARPNVISPVSRPSWDRRFLRKSFIYIHHKNYSGNHVVSEHYLNEEPNNTSFFLIPVSLFVSLGYAFLPLDLLIVQLIAMSVSFYVHLYFDNTTTWQDRGCDDLPGSGESNSSIFSTTVMPIAILQ